MAWKKSLSLGGSLSRDGVSIKKEIGCRVGMPHFESATERTIVLTNYREVEV